MGEQTGQRRFWLCLVAGTTGGLCHPHETIESAKLEAERLAKKEGKMVFVLEVVAACHVEEKPVVWEYPA